MPPTMEVGESVSPHSDILSNGYKPVMTSDTSQNDVIDDPASQPSNNDTTTRTSPTTAITMNGNLGNHVHNDIGNHSNHSDNSSHGDEPGEETPLEPTLEVEAGGAEGDSKKKGVKLKGNSLRDLDPTQRHLLGALCILYFCLYALLSLIGPFFPIEAEKKGLSPFETGVVISMSWLVMFFMAPLVGYLGTKIRLHYLTTGGVAVAGVVSILFGLLEFVSGREAFLALALVLRLLEGVSSATFCVTAWSVLIATMGDCIQMSMAVLMAVQGIAVIVSPLLGGVLYAAGGFLTPFVTLGVIVVLSTPLSWWVMRKVPVCEKADLGSIKNFVANIGVFITALFITSFTLTFKFLESYVALYIKEKFDYGPQMAGIILSLACLSFVITAVIWAQIIRLIGCVPVMVMGSGLGVIVMSFVAPGHFMNLDAHPWQVFSMTCLFGVAFAASQTPAVPRLLELARKRKMPENYLTYGLVSACYNCAFDLGCFTGPLVGGFMYNYLGFGWSTFSLGCVLTVVGSLVLLQYLIERHYKRKGERGHLLNAAPTVEKVALSSITGTTPDKAPPGETKVQRPQSMVELSRGVAFASP